MSRVMDRYTSLVDRLASIAPLALAAYLTHRHAADRRQLLVALERDRDAHRNECRELLTRITHPHLVPTATRPLDSRPDTVPEPITAAARAKQTWGSVGTSAPPVFKLPGDGDTAPVA